MAIKINIATLKEGDQTLEFTCDAKEIGLDDVKIKDKLLISIDLFKIAHQLDLKISVKCLIYLACDRCLENYDYPINSIFELVFVQKGAREKSFDDGYIKSFTPYMQTIDITEDIREFVLLSIPMKHLPQENKDGSCSWCGKTKEYWKNFIKESDNQ